MVTMIAGQKSAAVSKTFYGYTSVSRRWSMEINPGVLAIAIGLFAGMLFFMHIGGLVYAREKRPTAEPSLCYFSVIELALYLLLILFLIFLFLDANSRRESSKQLMLEEINAVNIAYWRLDLLSVQNRDTLRKDFRNYVELRLEAQKKFPDIDAVIQTLDKATPFLTRLWRGSVSACRQEDSPTTAQLLLPAMSRMMELANTSYLEAQIRPSQIRFVLLVALCLICGFVSGQASSGTTLRSRIATIALMAVLATVFYLILNMQCPQSGSQNADISKSMFSILLKGM
jgi:hypothetical protein